MVVNSDYNSIKKAYWMFALPKLKEKNKKTGLYSNVNSIPEKHWIDGVFGVNKCAIVSIAQKQSARV